jgi:hypothetical protein
MLKQVGLKGKDIAWTVKIICAELKHNLVWVHPC